MHIEQFEGELGIKIFNRSRSGALPTEEGKKSDYDQQPE
ncbi:UNVERIFIED_ORG: DNA-binding transcriptional LysR family regulator [Peribacillus simplex]